MGRRDTVWVARHKIEEEEVKRLQGLVEKNCKVKVTKLEASAILARKSKLAAMRNKDIVNFVQELRGATSLDSEQESLFS